MLHRVFHLHHGVALLRHLGARGDVAHVACAQRSGAAPRQGVALHGVAAGAIGGADGEAVHDGGGEGRDGHQGSDVLRQSAPGQSETSNGLPRPKKAPKHNALNYMVP